MIKNTEMIKDTETAENVKPYWVTMTCEGGAYILAKDADEAVEIAKELKRDEISWTDDWFTYGTKEITPDDPNYKIAEAAAFEKD